MLYDSEDFYGEDDGPQTTALETMKTLETLATTLVTEYSRCAATAI